MEQVCSFRILPANLISCYLLCCQSTGIISLDPWLEPHRDAIRHRFNFAERWINAINESEGGLDKFSKVFLFLIYSLSVR